MEKQCTKCGRTFDVEMFHKDKHSKDGHKNYCKLCQREMSKSYRSRNLEHILNYQAEYRKKNKKQQEINRKNKYNSLKTSCVKCGENRPWVIQFHHIDPSTKSFNITEGGSKNRDIESEVKKCVCLCSNCHDEFHYFYGKIPEKPKEALEEYLGVKIC